MGVLTVHLDKITDLLDKDSIGTKEPYVRFELSQKQMLGSNKDFGKNYSSKKKGEMHPVFGASKIHIYYLDGAIVARKNQRENARKLASACKRLR